MTEHIPRHDMSCFLSCSNILQNMTEHVRTDKSVIFLKFWHDFCYNYNVKVFTKANQFNNQIRSRSLWLTSSSMISQAPQQKSSSRKSRERCLERTSSSRHRRQRESVCRSLSSSCSSSKHSSHSVES